MNWKQISAEDYDWTVTRKPERPYIHDYTRTMTMKMALAHQAPGGGTIVNIDIEGALERIKAVDQITLGTHKIVYLVGWQYDGHDSKYPAWHECNPALRRPCDATALDSVKWLFEEAKKYNTTVSLHINMMDAYTDSPLWEEYVKNNLLCTDCRGEFSLGGVWGGKQAYLVCYKKEWESGFAAKRIDELCELLPIREAGTVHIDAMMNPCHRKGCCDLNTGERLGEPSVEGKRQIIRYFRELGVDVTSEFIYPEPEVENGRDTLIGLQPMAWVFSQRPEDYIRRPASLICGGITTRESYRGAEAALMNKVFGENVNGEDFFSMPDYKKEFLQAFCTTYLPFVYLNSKERLKLERYGENGFRAYFADDVMTDSEGPLIKKKDVLLRKGNKIMLPALWLSKENLVIYAEEKEALSWPIGDYLGNKVKVCKLTTEGLSEDVQVLDVVDGMIELSHDPNIAWLVTRV